MKRIIVLFLSLGVLGCLSCRSKSRSNISGIPEKVAIYPISPYYNILGKIIDGKYVKDSNSRWLSYVVYNIDEHRLKDTAYLKKTIKPFVDSLLLHMPQPRFQMEFYKKSYKLDTTFRETHNDLLYTMENNDDLILEYYTSDKLAWDGEWKYPQIIPDDLIITIENIKR